MTDREQTVRFANEIDALVQKYRDEYDISYAAVIGVLHMKAHLLCEEASEEDDE